MVVSRAVCGGMASTNLHAQGGEEDLDPISVLVDCMLSLLTRPSALVRLSPMLELIHHLKLLFEQTREVVRTVFRSFTADLHEAAFDLLVSCTSLCGGESYQHGVPMTGSRFDGNRD